MNALFYYLFLRIISVTLKNVKCIFSWLFLLALCKHFYYLYFFLNGGLRRFLYTQGLFKSKGAINQNPRCSVNIKEDYRNMVQKIVSTFERGLLMLVSGQQFILESFLFYFGKYNILLRVYWEIKRSKAYSYQLSNFVGTFLSSENNCKCLAKCVITPSQHV